MQFLEALIPIVAILSIFVVLPWMRMHYKSLERNQSALTGDEQQALSDLRHTAERMEARLVTLERILDAEAPGWRERT
jgi:phage shock protein B